MKIGVDIGGNHIAIAVVNGSEIIEKREEELVKASDKIILKFILENTNYFLSKYDIDLIGIATCGTPKNGKIEKSVNLNLQNFDIINEIKQDIDLPVVLRNDAKCAALAEKKYGVSQNYDDIVFLTIGTGIGGAYFLDGKLVKPKRYPGFEFGHILIEKNGILCNCGQKGCLEQYASISALKRAVTDRLNIERDISGLELIKTIEVKKEKLTDILDEFTDNLAIGISTIINILEPEIIVLAGSFVYYEELFMEELIAKLFLFNNKSRPEIKMAELKNQGGIIGATIIN